MLRAGFIEKFVMIITLHMNNLHAFSNIMLYSNKNKFFDNQ